MSRDKEEEVATEGKLMDTHTEKLFDMLPEDRRAALASEFKDRLYQEIGTFVKAGQEKLLGTAPDAESVAALAEPARKPAAKRRSSKKTGGKKSANGTKNGKAESNVELVRERLPVLMNNAGEEWFSRQQLLDMCKAEGLHVNPHKMTNGVVGVLVKSGVLEKNGLPTQQSRVRLKR